MVARRLENVLGYYRELLCLINVALVDDWDEYVDQDNDANQYVNNGKGGRGE